MGAPLVQSSAATAPAFAVEGLYKSFGGTLALADIALTIERSEIHGLVGPNGSGKSTLVKIMAGYHPADRVGRISIGGDYLPSGFTSGNIQSAGVGFVHQDLALVEQCSIEDNLAFGPAGFACGFGGRIDWKRHRTRAVAALDRVNLKVDPKLPVSALGPAQRTLVAIARALSQFDHAHLLVLDEPTARLPHSDVDLLLERLRRIAADGTAILYITHRMNELFAIAGRVTVFKDGRNVATLQTSATSVDHLARLMTGGQERTRDTTRGATEPGREVVSLRGIFTDRMHDVNLAVRAGEIVALTGAIGSGAEDCGSVIYGLKKPLAGEIAIGADTYRAMRISVARKLGVAYLPPERSSAGFPESSVEDNILVADFRRVTRGVSIASTAARRDAASVVAQMGVVPPNPQLPLRSLSGGNQQKVLFGKWLRVSPRLLILNEPTYGVDVISRRELFAGIERAREAGVAVLWITTDLDEAMMICDRIGVFFKGKLHPIRNARDASVSDLQRTSIGL
jgi:ribose transport system ATP-binding protein